MKKKWWCEHIIWKPYIKPWWVLIGPIDIEADSEWHFCPICGKPRPKKGSK